MTDGSCAVLHNEVKRYAKKNGYPISDFKQIKCACMQEDLRLFSDDDEGAAFAECPSCQTEIDIRDSRKYGEEVVQNLCDCGAEELLLAVGIANDTDSDSVRWVYVGAHCRKCGLSGVYTDWNER